LLSNLLRSYFPANSLRARLGGGMAWVVTGSMCRMGSNFVAGVLSARIFGVMDFGKFGVVQSTVLVVVSLALLGMDLSTTKYVSSLRTKDVERTGRVIGFSLAGTSILAVFVGVMMFHYSLSISNILLPGKEMSLEMKLASGWVVFEMMNLIQIKILMGVESFRRSAFYFFWQSLLSLPAIVLGAYYGGLIGAILGVTIAAALGMVIGHILVVQECKRHNIKISYREMLKEKSIMRMSLMVWLSTCVVQGTTWFSGILLARQPSGLSDFGLFNAASRFTHVLTFLSSMVYQVMVPVLANLEAEGNRRGFMRGLLGMGGVSVGITFTGAILFIGISPHLMQWYGEEFLKGSAVLKVLALGSVANAVWMVTAAGLWALEKSKEMLALDILRASLLIVLCILGLAATATNLAWALTLSFAAGTGIMMLVLRRVLHGNSY
jgi:O-antigen/teichoic acid export membrane protein